jgi:hypothetical protein
MKVAVYVTHLLSKKETIILRQFKIWIREKKIFKIMFIDEENRISFRSVFKQEQNKPKKVSLEKY